LSERDKQLVETLGISVRQMAITLKKSRQTVNRGVHAEADYFKLPDLAKALDTWRTSDQSLYAVAKNKICEIYPEITEAVLSAVENNETTPAFSVDLPAEYWLVCGDFIGFRNSLTVCWKQIEEICQHSDAQLKLFVNKRDLASAQRFALKYRDSGLQVVPCINVDLQLVPTSLLRMDDNDVIALFGVSDNGFIALSRQEASRLRLVIQNTLLPSADVN
jgi:hypothetical protein